MPFGIPLAENKRYISDPMPMTLCFVGGRKQEEAWDAGSMWTSPFKCEVHTWD